MTFEQNFKKIKKMFVGADVSMIDHHLAFQFDIIGEGAGIFYAEVKDGRLIIEPYDYRDNDAVLTATADVFIKIISRKLNPVAAFSLGKLKISGDIGKALEIQKLL